MKFEILKKSKDSKARIANITTAHGEFLTPAFMPVGTRAFVNHMNTAALKNTRSHIILGGNTYHMLVSPGLEVIEKLGGMHQMMGWNESMLTDSGGYQVFSLSRNEKLCRIDENGAHFKHPDNGKKIDLTPETSIAAQKIIGADIIMAFDQCTPETEDRELINLAMERTHAWLMRSINEHTKHIETPYGYSQALFGIIQGGNVRELREKSAEIITAQKELDGIAIGGEVIGYNMAETRKVLEWLQTFLPENKPRYTMGVGLQPQDLIDVIEQGIDMFDCVAPTRNARHGALYCGEFVIENNQLKFKSELENGRLLIKKSIYATDLKPIMESCDCFTCKNHTRAYLHFLFKQDAGLYRELGCIHNVHVMQMTCEKMRNLIMRGNDNE